MTTSNHIPRRIRIDQFTPAEKAIYEASQAVEAAGASSHLTDAVTLLGAARDKVADHVDGLPEVPDNRLKDAAHNDDLHRAVRFADEIRCAHNGIMSVRLYLGHDGNNECDLSDYGNGEGKPDCHANGNSGRSLLEAVERAYSNWRFQRLSQDGAWQSEAIINAARRAIDCFGAEEPVFNSAGFLHQINAGYHPISQEQAIVLLKQCRRIVPLLGGAHWFLLPNNFQREPSS